MPQQRTQLAQNPPAEPTHTPESIGSHASESHSGGHHYKLGDIPDPGILVWHSFFVAIILIVFALAATRKLAAIPRGYRAAA